MPQKEQPKNKEEKEAETPLSETIANAHSARNGAIRLSEDGLIEPGGETSAEAGKEPPQPEEY